MIGLCHPARRGTSRKPDHDCIIYHVTTTNVYNDLWDTHDVFWPTGKTAEKENFETNFRYKWRHEEYTLDITGLYSWRYYANVKKAYHVFLVVKPFAFMFLPILFCFTFEALQMLSMTYFSLIRYSMWVDQYAIRSNIT